jgi:uncharacterized spore protein YtfJ
LSFGFASGGGEYNKGQGSKETEINETYPFAGGAGAGITVQPVAFMVVDNNEMANLKIGTKVRLSTKAFSPTIG